MSDHWESLKERLRKLQALASRGVGGEAVEAQRKIDLLCKKNGFQIEWLDDDKKDHVEFRYTNFFEKKLIVQCAAMLFGDFEAYRLKRSRSKIIFELTKLEAIDLRSCYEFYLPLLKDCLNEALHAFYFANGIFPPKSSESEDASSDEIRAAQRAFQMSQFMENNPWRRALPS